MSDRCYMEMHFRKQDRELFVDVFGPPHMLHVSEAYKDAYYFYNDESNYGEYEKCLALAKKGAVFIGFHTEGGEYEANAFVAIGGEYVDVTTSNQSCPLVRVESDGQGGVTIPQTDLMEAQKYFELLAAVEKEMLPIPIQYTTTGKTNVDSG